jgi:hypothetical protein
LISFPTGSIGPKRACASSAPMNVTAAAREVSSPDFVVLDHHDLVRVAFTLAVRITWLRYRTSMCFHTP